MPPTPLLGGWAEGGRCGACLIDDDEDDGDIWPWGGSARRVWRARIFARKALRAWETASLDAHKKPLMWPWGACWLRD